MGLYDLPAVVEFITNYKNDSLVYVGHSMGTTMFYVMASRRPDIAERVRVMIGLAPVAYISHLKSPIRIIAPFADNIEVIFPFSIYPQTKPHDDGCIHPEKYCLLLIIIFFFSFS